MEAPATPSHPSVLELSASLPFETYRAPEDLKRPERLFRLRHSAAHVMAEAVLELFPTAQVATGPAIEHGFYYDFDLPRALTPADLEQIARRMKKIIKRNWRFEVVNIGVDQARELFQTAGQEYKLEVIDSIVERQNPESLTLFRQNKFVDLCAGPHVSGTKTCKHFKLLRVSGAYWRGDNDRPMLQRIYGTAWENAEDLESYMTFLEEAKNRNHKRIGIDLDLFHFHKVAPGSCFWTPRGYTVYQEFLDYWRQSHRERGYQEIFNPVLYKKDLYEQSGHYHHYKDDMFILEADDTEYCLKPMNCPDTFLFYTSKRRSFRELPLRISEGGILHRNELTGALNGLFRVRQFTQDDAHIFVTEQQVQNEIAELLDIAREVYALFNLNYRFALSTRPEKFMGDPELWDQAEESLRAALD
ncbi:MAG: threonine--tRNA ligase, partial [Myxococcales bacterium]|nr:threonine--tRNA ligase [Myxococcales bacterium]